MKRRRLLIGLGGLAGAGTAFGSGAFSSISANRDVTVEVAGDTDAFLKMDASSSANGQAFAEDPQNNNNGLLALDFSSTSAGGQGVGTDSVYNFDDVFTVTNQGTQPVYVWATFSGGSGNFTPSGSNTDIWLYPGSDSTKKLHDNSDSVVQLDVGETVRMGVHVNTHEITQDQGLTATIHANVTRPSGSNAFSPGQPNIAYVTQGSTGASNRFGSLEAALMHGPWDTIRIESAQTPYEFNVGPSLVLDTQGLTIEGESANDPPTVQLRSFGSLLTPLDGAISVQNTNITVRNLDVEIRVGGIFGGQGYIRKTAFSVESSGFEIQNVAINTEGYTIATSGAVSAPTISDIDIRPDLSTGRPAMFIETIWSSLNGTSITGRQDLVDQLYTDGVRPLDTGVNIDGAFVYPSQTGGP